MESGVLMLKVFSGAVVTAAGAGSFWYLLPRNGAIHPLATKPVFDQMIPISILTAVSIGIMLIVDGIAG